MNSAVASNAFAKWETLEPAAASSSSSSSSAKPERVSLATPSLRPKLPASQHQLQPPPTPNVGTRGGINDSFVVAGGGFPRSSFLPREEPPASKPMVAAAAVFAGSDSTRGERYAADSGGNTGTVDHNGKERNTSPAGLAPFGTVDAGTRARAPAAVKTAAAGPQSLPHPEAPRALPESGGRNQESGPSFWGERTRPSDGAGGSGGVAKDDDAEALLARLAGKAKQAAAAALSASAASGGMTRRPLPSPTPAPAATPPPLLPRHDRDTDATARAAPTGAVTRNVKPVLEVESIADAAFRVRFSEDKSHLGAAIERGAAGEDRRDESMATAVGKQMPDGAAAGGVAVDGGARLAELCKEDKTKVARLMQDLVKLRQEKEGQKTRFERLRAQNESIVKEMAGLKVKFGQSMQLLRKYQSIVQEGGAADGGVAGMRGKRGVAGTGKRSEKHETAAAAAAAAVEIQTLRETLRLAEESARKAETEAAAARSGRTAMAEELRRARGQAD
ncbi:unnamed protein product, partial [Ectocarpus fasciculatus]